MRGFAPADEALLFRQKCPKPFPPVRGPVGVPPPPPRIKMARELAPLKQPRRRGRFGAAAPPHPTLENKGSISKFFEMGRRYYRILVAFVNGDSIAVGVFYEGYSANWGFYAFSHNFYAFFFEVIHCLFKVFDFECN